MGKSGFVLFLFGGGEGGLMEWNWFFTSEDEEV